MAASYRQVRQYERAPIRERGTMVVNGETHAGMVSRIGGGGLFFETNLPLQKGQTVLLRFRLACLEEPLVVKGEIRWVSATGATPSGVGVAFIDLDARKRQQIVEFVAERGNVLCEVDEMLDTPDLDVSQLRALLAKVDLDGADSLEEVRDRVKKGLDGFFSRA